MFTRETVKLDTRRLYILRIERISRPWALNRTCPQGAMVLGI